MGERIRYKVYGFIAQKGREDEDDYAVCDLAETKPGQYYGRMVEPFNGRICRIAPRLVGEYTKEKGPALLIDLTDRWMTLLRDVSLVKEE